MNQIREKKQKSCKIQNLQAQDSHHRKGSYAVSKIQLATFRSSVEHVEGLSSAQTR